LYIPLSQRDRTGFSEAEVLLPGIPEHLRLHCRKFLEDCLQDPYSGEDTERLLYIASALRIPLNTGRPARSLFDQIISVCEQNDSKYLDVIDTTLKLHPMPKAVSDLRNYLELGGSEWTVDKDGKNLVKRVADDTSRLKEKATSLSDDVSRHLENAWNLTYGRPANASESWAHSIKALEAALGPIISPDNQRATLGTILQNLEQKPSKWRLHVIDKEDEGIEAIIQMLKVIWPNPDRHGSGKTREPTLEEAEVVLIMTTTIVAIARRLLSRT